MTFGLPRDIDHHSALLEELHRTAGAVAWLGQQVAALDPKDVVWGKTRKKRGGEDHGVTHEAGVNVWVRLWQGERRHLLDVTKACHAAGIDERRMQLAETAGEQLALVLRAVFARLVLSDEQWDLVAVVVPEELRKLAALTSSSEGVVAS